MGKLLAAINAWFDKQALRDEMFFHCEHQPAGACSDECEAIVRAERW